MAIQEATPIILTAEERITLEGWVRSSKTEQRLVARAKIVLLASGGVASRAIAREVGCARGVVSKWRLRFAQDRLAGLADAAFGQAQDLPRGRRSARPGAARPAAARGLRALERTLDRPDIGQRQ